MFLLTATDVELKLVDTLSSDDTVLSYISGMQSSHIEKETVTCPGPLSLILR